MQWSGQYQDLIRTDPGVKNTFASLIDTRRASTNRTQKYIPKGLHTMRNPLEQSYESLRVRKGTQTNRTCVDFNSIREWKKKHPRKTQRVSEVDITNFNPQPSQRTRIISIEENNQPKLRETNSTMCQSPKAAFLLKRPKIQEYNKLKLLGKGKFGDVYLAVHKATGFLVALKVIKKINLLQGTLEENQKAINQLTRQIKIQAFLTHPNLVKLYDFFADRINIYLVMELVCDGHLYDLLEKCHTFSEETASIVVREVLEGVDYMHNMGIIHRDIKLENIVLAHGMAKICDFGWSVYCPRSFRNTLCGTPLYLSPEILMGQHYNKKIDVWALGALTHELVTSQNPFKIQHKDDLSKIVTEDFEMQTGSSELRSFITVILRKNPSKRPDTTTIKHHPFIEKYREFQTSQELCRLLNPKTQLS